MEGKDGKTIVAEFKEELLTLKTPSKARAAFLAGAIRGAGSLTVKNGKFGLLIAHSNGDFIEKCTSIAEETLHIPSSLRMLQSAHSLRTEAIYELEFEGDSVDTLCKMTGVLTEDGLQDRLPKSYFENQREKQAFLRSAFLAGGGMTLPVDGVKGEKRTGYAGYLVEISFTDEGVAEDTRDLINSFGITAKIRERKNRFTVYLQGQEAMTDFMTALGATNTMFQLCDFVAKRSMKNAANRNTNCQMANLEKTINAVEAQFFAIETLKKRKILQTLDEKLQSAAELRLKYPTAPLSELAEKSVPPVSKSGLNHRLKKLVELAEL